MDEDQQLRTSEELQALPVGAAVYDQDGREYRVELWADHGGDGGDGRVLVAPGHKSGTEAFLSTSQAFLQRPAAVVRQEQAAARYDVHRGQAGESEFVFRQGGMVYGLVDLEAVDHNLSMRSEKDWRRRSHKTELWEFDTAEQRAEFAEGWRHEKRRLFIERMEPAWTITDGWPEGAQ